MPSFFKMIFKDFSRSLLIIYISLLVVIPLSFIFIVILLWRDRYSQISDWVLIAFFIVWELIFLGGLAAFVIVVTRRRKKWLDSVFTPLGLVGHRYLINWWEYRGMIQGREVLVRFYKGPTLDLFIQTPLQTRFGVTTPDQPGLFIADLLNKTPMRVSNPRAQGLCVFALDEAWMNDFLSSDEVADALSRLVNAAGSWPLIRQVLLAPGLLKLTLYRNKNLFEVHFDSQEIKG